MHDQLQTLENDALRGILGLDRKAPGMVVHAPDRDDADYPLKEWDLITKIGDHEIDNVGMVQAQGRPPAAVPVPDPEARQGRQGPPEPDPQGEADRRSSCP